MGLHSAITTALHRIGLVQSSDPGAIGAGKAWLDSDDNALRVRNATDAAWLGPYATFAGGTFTGDIVVPDEAYDATAWNGSLEVPTKNAVRDKIETLSAGSGKLAQVVNTVSGAVATGTTTIPLDDTKPQNTEGTEFMTLSITPTSSSNKLFIQIKAFATLSASNLWTIGALFQDSGADALAVDAAFQTIGTAAAHLVINHWMTAGTTSATTFKLRIGGHSASTVTFNGQSGGRLFGGVTLSSFTISEIVP